MRSQLNESDVGSDPRVARDLNRGYYTVARRYEFYFRVSKIIFYSLAALVLFLPRDNKIHIFKPLCNVLFII